MWGLSSGGSSRRALERILAGLILVLAIANVALLVGPRFRKRNVPFQQSSSPLSCSQLAQIGRWSGAKYGGAGQVDLNSADFSKRTTELFLEKLDPYKILFTQADLALFREQAPRQWLAV